MQFPTFENAGAAELVDRLDAHMFTGDTFHNAQNRLALRAYIARWSRELVEIEQDPDDMAAAAARAAVRDHFESVYERYMKTSDPAPYTSPELLLEAAELAYGRVGLDFDGFKATYGLDG